MRGLLQVVWIGLVSLVAGVAGAAGVSVTVAPEVVWVVEVDGIQKVNFDLLVTSEATRPLRVAAVRAAVFDRAGALVTARELTGLGVAPALETLHAERIEPGQRVTIFNPFHEFAAAVELATLRLTLVLAPDADEGGAGGPPGEEVTAVVEVHPRPATLVNALRLPLDGTILVWDGSDFYSHHRRFDIAHPFVVEMGIAHNITRYALDLMVVDGDGRRHRGSGRRLEDYPVFGRPVLAPADGVVVDAVDGRVDSPIGEMTVDYEEYVRTKDLRLFGGNHVLIDHGHGEVSYLGHLQHGSLRVATGDRVRAGQMIARVGNSGDSLEPHLHYHLLTSADRDGEQLPPVFRSFRRYHGGRASEVASGCVDTGDVIESTWSAPLPAPSPTPDAAR